jgi:hypothetical protein
VLRCRVLQRIIKLGLAVGLLFALCFACYRHPVADYFDRFVYEAIVLGKSLPIDAVYSIVKHENARTEASALLESPSELRELERLYAIRPLYIEILKWLSLVIPLRKAIDLVSAASYFGIGIIAIVWTKRPILAALLMAAYPLLVLARIGGPDALSALLVISGMWFLVEEKSVRLGLILLYLSLAVRTDNMILVLLVVAWLVWEKRMRFVAGLVLFLFAIGIVFAINRWAGNYGWIALFHYSFVAGGPSPTYAPASITLGQYFSALSRGIAAIAVHISLWVLLGILVWLSRRSQVLILVALADVVHFLMFPSPEDRYFVWSYIVIGILLVRPLPQSSRPVLNSQDSNLELQSC